MSRQLIFCFDCNGGRSSIADRLLQLLRLFWMSDALLLQSARKAD